MVVVGTVVVLVEAGRVVVGGAGVVVVPSRVQSTLLGQSQNPSWGGTLSLKYNSSVSDKGGHSNKQIRRLGLHSQYLLQLYSCGR